MRIRVPATKKYDGWISIPNQSWRWKLILPVTRLCLTDEQRTRRSTVQNVGSGTSCMLKKCHLTTWVLPWLGFGEMSGKGDRQLAKSLGNARDEWYSEGSHQSNKEGCFSWCVNRQEPAGGLCLWRNHHSSNPPLRRGIPGMVSAGNTQCLLCLRSLVWPLNK